MEAVFRAKAEAKCRARAMLKDSVEHLGHPEITVPNSKDPQSAARPKDVKQHAESTGF